MHAVARSADSSSIPLCACMFPSRYSFHATRCCVKAPGHFRWTAVLLQKGNIKEDEGAREVSAKKHKQHADRERRERGEKGELLLLFWGSEGLLFTLKSLQTSQTMYSGRGLSHRKNAVKIITIIAEIIHHLRACRINLGMRLAY